MDYDIRPYMPGVIMSVGTKTGPLNRKPYTWGECATCDRPIPMYDGRPALLGLGWTVHTDHNWQCATCSADPAKHKELEDLWLLWQQTNAR